MIAGTFVFADDFPLVKEDPGYAWFIHQWRQKQNIRTIFKSYPIVVRKKPDGFENNFGHVYLLPSIVVNNKLPDYQMQWWSYTKWWKMSFFVDQVITREKYGLYYLGTRYSRAGMSTRFVDSFLQYRGEYIDITFGRNPVHWDQSWSSGIIQSGLTPPFENLTTKLRIGQQFELELLAGQLSSDFFHDTLSGDQRIRRNIAGHRLNYSSNDDRISFSIGEEIIYTGINRPIELYYLNPVVPYFFTALEGDETTNPDNDNSIIFASGRYILKQNFSVYFEGVVDDFQVDKNNTPNAIGYQLGIDGAYRLIDKQLSYNLELTSIDTWTYIHHGQFTSWQNREHPIGYRYGPDCRTVSGMLDYWQNTHLRFSVSTTYLEKGQNNLTTVWNSPGTRGAPFPSKLVRVYTFYSVSVGRYFRTGVLELGYSNFPVGNAEIAGVIDKSRGSFYLEAQLNWGYHYHLN